MTFNLTVPLSLREFKALSHFTLTHNYKDFFPVTF